MKLGTKDLIDWLINFATIKNLLIKFASLDFSCCYLTLFNVKNLNLMDFIKVAFIGYFDSFMDSKISKFIVALINFIAIIVEKAINYFNRFESVINYSLHSYCLYLERNFNIEEV